MTHPAEGSPAHSTDSLCLLSITQELPQLVLGYFCQGPKSGKQSHYKDMGQWGKSCNHIHSKACWREGTAQVMLAGHLVRLNAGAQSLLTWSKPHPNIHVVMWMCVCGDSCLCMNSDTIFTLNLSSRPLSCLQGALPAYEVAGWKDQGLSLLLAPPGPTPSGMGRDPSGIQPAEHKKLPNSC